MQITLDSFRRATGGHTTVPPDWMPATGPRSLIGTKADPCQLWFKFHGAAHGFEEDPTDYSYFEFIANKGCEFEEAWIKNYAPHAARCLLDDRDVVDISKGLVRTVQLIRRGAPVITHAALVNAEAKVYGGADVLWLESDLFRHLPNLQPADWTPADDNYTVIDCKFTSHLGESRHKNDLEIYTVQLSIYAHCVAVLTGKPVKRAYLATRDSYEELLCVDVDAHPQKPIREDIAELRRTYARIKLDGGKLRPWRDHIVRCNYANERDAPWHEAKKQIAAHYVPIAPLEVLPHIAETQARQLRMLGFDNVAELITAEQGAVDWKGIKGVGPIVAKQINAILKAQRSERPSKVPSSAVPEKVAQEYFCDMEFLSNVNCNFSQPWPECLAGRELVFMIGLGWEEDRDFKYKQFTADAESPEAEKQMFEEFLSFLRRRGALETDGTVRLYHWSAAEVWQSAKRAELLGLPDLAHLPWYDLSRPVASLPLGLPGCFGYGLKPIAKAVSQISASHRVSWPEELSSGLGASVMGWAMLAQDSPLESKEFKTLSEYLKVDCESLWQVLRWMRQVAFEDMPPSKLPNKWIPRVRTVGWPNVSGGRHCIVAGRGWYDFARNASSCS